MTRKWRSVGQDKFELLNSKGKLLATMVLDDEGKWKLADGHEVVRGMIPQDKKTSAILDMANNMVYGSWEKK